MSKSKEELYALKEEVETVNKKLADLTEDELAQVTGGIDIHYQSIKRDLEVELMRPFFTGKQRLVPGGGRVDKFKKRYHI